MTNEYTYNIYLNYVWTCLYNTIDNFTGLKVLLLNVILLEKGRAVDKIKKSGTEIGKHVAEKSKGLFSADDWQCSK